MAEQNKLRAGSADETIRRLILKNRSGQSQYFKKPSKEEKKRLARQAKAYFGEF